MYNPPAMHGSRFFFAQALLDRWVHDNRVELTATELVLKGEGRRYRLVEAVRVLAEVTGALDVHELVGRVKTVSFVQELGAELLVSSMLIGDLAYEVVPGFLGVPEGSFDEHLKSEERARAVA